MNVLIDLVYCVDDVVVDELVLCGFVDGGVLVV